MLSHAEGLLHDKLDLPQLVIKLFPPKAVIRVGITIGLGATGYLHNAF
jgi:hypothetical protein